MLDPISGVFPSNAAYKDMRPRRVTRNQCSDTVVLQPSLRCRRSTPCPIHICPISVKREYYCPPSGQLNPYLTNLSMNHYLRTYRHVTLLRLLYILYLGNWQRPTVCTLHLSAQTLLHVRTCWWCAYFNVTDKYEYKYIP